MGKKIYLIQNVEGLDIDEKWQLQLVEVWLRTNGFSEQKTIYKKHDSFYNFSVKEQKKYGEVFHRISSLEEEVERLP